MVVRDVWVFLLVREFYRVGLCFSLGFYCS